MLWNPKQPIIHRFTNRSRYFQNTSTIETGISDFHKLVVTVLKHRNYKTFKEQLFRIEQLDKELAKGDVNNTELAEFHNELAEFHNEHTPYLKGLSLIISAYLK